MPQVHACRLVPRALYPRWDSPARVRETFAFCRAVGAEELMLFPTGQLISPGWLSDRELRQRVRRATAVARLAARQGIDITINECCFTDDLGLSTNVRGVKPWPWAVDITGKTAVGYRCFLAPEVRAAAAQRLVALASTGAHRIFTDDEVRHDWHPSHTRNEGAHYCFCPLHLAGFARWLKERRPATALKPPLIKGGKIAREELVRALQSARPADQALRQEWLRFKRQVLLDFITQCQQAVHRAWPQTRLGQMTTFFHFASLGGISFGDQVGAWAGALQPLCRPAQGWYGDHNRTGLVLGMAQSLWTIHCLPPDTELYSEVDWGCPWTQLRNSARACADYQIKANLLLNIKVQSLLYLGEGPEERLVSERLVKQLRRSRKVFDALAAQLPARARRVGLQFLMTEKLAEVHPLRCRGPAGDAADPWGVTGAGLGLPPWSLAFGTLARTGLPLTFDEAPVAVLTGGIAPALGREAVQQLLATRNLIIDGTAAADLERMGLLSRFGVRLLAPSPSPLNERLAHDPLNGKSAGQIVPLSQLLPTSRVRLYELHPSAGQTLRALNHLVDAAYQVKGAGVVLASGLAGGRRACLLPFDLADVDAWGFAVRKSQWLGILRALGAQDAAPAWLDEAYEVWPLCYRLSGDPRLWIGLINFGYDAADDVTCWVNWRGPARVRYVDEQGRVKTLGTQYLRRQPGRIGVKLQGAHAVAPLDVRLLIVEPR